MPQRCTAWWAAPLIVAACTLVSTSPAASQSWTDTRFRLELTSIASPAFEQRFRAPSFYIEYPYLRGAVHQDGYDFGWAGDTGVDVGFDFYAFSPGGWLPREAVNETWGYAGFRDGPIAWFTNSGGLDAQLDFSIRMSGGYGLSGEMDYGFSRASAQATLLAYGADGIVLRRSFRDADQVGPGERGSGGYLLDESFSFWVKPGETLTVALSGVRNTLHLRNAYVPEPAVWAQMIAGFALAGAALRKRRVRDQGHEKGPGDAPGPFPAHGSV